MVWWEQIKSAWPVVHTKRWDRSLVRRRMGWGSPCKGVVQPGSILIFSAAREKFGSDRTQEDYCRLDSVTIMGVWSDGFSCALGPLSISQPSSRFASVGDNKK